MYRKSPRKLLMTLVVAVGIAASAGPASAFTCLDLNAAGPLGPVNSFTLDNITFTAGEVGGVPVQIGIRHVYPFGAPDANFDIDIPWSENDLGANAFADIVFDPGAFGLGVPFVTIDASHTSLTRKGTRY